MKVGHVGKQPTSLNGELGSLTDFHGDKNHVRVSQKCHATLKSILTMSCGPKRQRSVRQGAMMKTDWGSKYDDNEAIPKASWDDDIISIQSEEINYN